MCQKYRSRKARSSTRLHIEGPSQQDFIAYWCFVLWSIVPSSYELTSSCGVSEPAGIIADLQMENGRHSWAGQVTPELGDLAGTAASSPDFSPALCCLRKYSVQGASWRRSQRGSSGSPGIRQPVLRLPFRGQEKPDGWANQGGCLMHRWTAGEAKNEEIGDLNPEMEGICWNILFYAGDGTTLNRD